MRFSSALLLQCAVVTAFGPAVQPLSGRVRRGAVLSRRMADNVAAEADDELSEDQAEIIAEAQEIAKVKRRMAARRRAAIAYVRPHDGSRSRS